MNPEALIYRGRHLWAKSAETAPGHSLLAHLLDVGLVAEALLQGRSNRETQLLAQELDITRVEAHRLAIILAALHDIGKATPSFQSKWPPGAPAEALGRGVLDVPHGRAGGILLRAWLCDAGIPVRLAASMANAVAIHHGNRLPATYASPATYDPRSLAEDELPWREWRSALIEDVISVFGNLPPLRTKKYLRGRTWAMLAGLTSVADWIGSSLTHFGQVTDPAAYLVARRPEVQRKLDEIAWPLDGPWWRAPSGDGGFASWFTSADMAIDPRPLQQAVVELVAGDQRPALMIVEAPMGEGKTEAAFYALVQPFAQDGAYFALPTQATSDAMHARLTRFVEAHMTRPVDVALAHGAANTNPGIRASAAAVDAGGIEAEAVAESWFSRGRRELLAEIGVGTVDQALLSVLPARHFFVRMWGLAGKVVVFDEVHAYDAYTRGLIVELVRWLAALGSSILVMSATFPSSVRRQLVEAYLDGLGEEAPAIAQVDYPRLTKVDGSSVETRQFPAFRSSVVRLENAPYDLTGLADDLVRSVRQGAAVAAVVNDVNRAQELYQHCKRLHDDVTLLHARLPLDERKQREAEVVKRFGPEGSSSDRHGLVVATQVVEQSLDLDFDVLFSDLAPIDLLLQRSGRMHRHRRSGRPAPFSEPSLYVAGISAAGNHGPVREAMATVYAELIMWRTWGAVVHRSELHLPADIDALVQQVYSSVPIAALDTFADELRRAEAEYLSRIEAEAAAAREWSLGGPRNAATDSWGDAGRADDDIKAYQLRVPTRLGEDSLSVIPILVSDRGWQVYPGSRVATPQGARRASKEFVAAAVSRQIRVSRKLLVARLRAQKLPVWWGGTGELRQYLPLALDERGVSTADGSVRLDDELGLVYGKGGARESG